MATNTGNSWTTTIIINTSLQSHETIRMLQAQRHKIRLSDSVELDSFVFPQSGTAFKLVEPEKVKDQSILVEQIQKFVALHQNSFVLFYSPFNRETQQKMLSFIQERFFGSKLYILPVRNNDEIINGMLTIAKATTKPHVDCILNRMATIRSEILDISPVLEMYKKLTKAPE
ncbi:protein SPO16 homolog isoform X2 [Corythoichthys intestinalis]|nr:protein SPO16 homolog isoform X2 [Corythoichthys intestinalis]XP_061790328.1 protein SPO16 homolog [Nerophis lumbriciformis]